MQMSQVAQLSQKERAYSLAVKAALYSYPKDVLVCIGSAGSIAAYANDPRKKHLINARYIPNEQWNGGFRQGKYDGGPQCFLQLIRMFVNLYVCLD